jgi:hypothetical protein
VKNCQNRDALSGGESVQGWDNLYIAVEGESWTVLKGWPAVVVRIQCFRFGLRGEATGRSVTERWSGCSELILATWKVSVTWHGGMRGVGYRRDCTAEGKGSKRR